MGKVIRDEGLGWGSSAQIYLRDDVTPHVDAYKPIFIN